MNNFDVFTKKVNEVLELMLEGSLPKNIDDTLLEKFLGVLREGSFPASDDNTESGLAKKARYDTDGDKTAYMVDLLDKSLILSFLKKAVSSLEGSGPKLNSSIETFSLILLGIFSEQSQIFSSREIQRLLHFLNNDFIEKEISASMPSTQVAVLSCLTSIAHHDEGISWLIQKNILGAAFLFFSGSTYYVRKSAVTFFTTVLIKWSTSPAFYSKDSTYVTTNHTISRFIEHFISGLQSSNDSGQNDVISECCISVLRLTIEKSDILHKFLCDNYNLSSKVLSVIKCILSEKEPQENILELLVESLVFSNSLDNNIITDVIKVLLQRKFISSVIILLSLLLLRQFTPEKPVCKEQLVFVMWPIITLSNITVTFTPPAQEFTEMLSHQMKDKSSCSKLVRLSLTALSKLVQLLDVETLSCIVHASVELLHHTITKHVQSSIQLNISGNKKVQVSTLQFFASLIEDPVCQRLTNTINLQLMDSLISTIENPAADSNITTQALKLISRIMSQGAGLCNDLPKDLKKRLAGMVQRKLLDIHWSVIDTALEVVAQMIIGCRDDELWKEWICTLSIHTAVWDVAASSEAEGYVRATALRVLISMCLCPFMWEQLKSQRQADEDTIVSVLCKLSKDPDVFVQRESISSLFKWMQASNVNVPSNNSTSIFNTLTSAVKFSLDWDTKLIALRAWQWVAEKELSCFSSPTQKSNVEETLLFLCNIGYGSSLLSALSDHDTTVQHEAAQALFSLRQTLLDLGLDKTSLLLTDSSETSAIDHCKFDTTTALDSDSFKLQFSSEHARSQAERNAALDDVLNMDTVGQIHQVLRVEEDCVSLQDCPSLFDSPFPSLPCGDKASCSTGTFWKSLWSDDLESVLTASSKSSDVYINNPVALLDDIIAAKVGIVCPHNEEYQDADCY